VSKPAALVMLEKHLIGVRARGENAVLMMDEAQNLSMDLLEEIRLLSNLEHRGDKLLQIFLVGQPELEAHLARHELRQLRQRITVHYRLNPLAPEETLGYIQHHINVAGGNGPSVFPADTCREIYRLSHGIPREINTLASSALIAAYADGSPSVRVEHIATAAAEGDFKSVLMSTRRPEPGPAPARPAPAVSSPPPVAAAPPAQAPQAPRQRVPAQSAEFFWPPLPEMATGASRPVAPAPASAIPAPEPAPPRPVEPQPAARDRGEITRGLMAAMRRAEAPPPPPPAQPTPQPMQRPQFASRPMPAPAPIPLPARNPAPPHVRPMMAPSMSPAMGSMAPAVSPVHSGDSSRADLSGLPPRLRDRLEREASREDAGSMPARNWLIAVTVIATLGMMLLLMQRFGAIDLPILRGAAGRPVARTQTAPSSLGSGAALGQKSADPTAALIDSLRREVETAKHSATLQSASATDREAQTTKPREQATTDQSLLDTPALPPLESGQPAETGTRASDPAAASSTHFGLGVAAYLDADRAREEKERLARDTGLPGMVLPYRDEGTTMYRVVLGRWSKTADAEKAANSLMEQGLINEARVVTVPQK